MASLYGRRWYAEQGNEADGVWMRELSRLKPEDVARGWESCRDSGESHPPTLPQFLARVKAARQALPHLGRREDPVLDALHAAAARQAQKELPSPDKAMLERLKSAPDVAKAAFAELRSKLPERVRHEVPEHQELAFVAETEPKEQFAKELQDWQEGRRPESWQAKK